MSVCTYMVASTHANILAVGWLGKRHPFPTGQMPADAFQRLLELTIEPWQPFVAGGAHSCDFCRQAHGSANLFIPHSGRLFIAPELIVHYVSKHEYRPPDEFCLAVLECPDMDSKAYLDAVIACQPPEHMMPM